MRAVSDLAALRQEIERIRGLGTPPNEEATKVQVVLPILRALGWDERDPSLVSTEYKVDPERNDAVDITLGPSQRPVALIEVKAVGVRLDDPKVLDQILGYAYRQGANLCALTTGLIWWLYLPKEGGKWQDRRFAEFDVRADSIDQLLDDFETYLGHTALVSHEAVKRAQGVLAARLDSERLQREIPQIWTSMLSNPPPELIEIIEARVFSSIRLRPTGDQISEFLAGVTGSVRADSPTPSPPVPKKQASQKTTDQKLGGKGKVSKPDGFSLWGRKYPAKKWTDVWHGVAEALYDRHPDRFQDVVGRPRGKRSYVEVDRQLLSPAYRVRDSQYWVGGSGNASVLQGRCVNLLELLGYGQTDIEFFDR